MNEISPGVEEELAFKDFSIFSSGGHLVYQSGTILAILVGSHLGNIPMEFESCWPKGLGGESIKGRFLLFQVYRNFATLFTKLSVNTFYKLIS